MTTKFNPSQHTNWLYQIQPITSRKLTIPNPANHSTPMDYTKSSQSQYSIFTSVQLDVIAVVSCRFSSFSRSHISSKQPRRLWERTNVRHNNPIPIPLPLPPQNPKYDGLSTILSIGFQCQFMLVHCPKNFWFGSIHNIIVHPLFFIRNLFFLSNTLNTVWWAECP